MEPEYLSSTLVRMSVDVLCSAEEEVAEAVTFRYPPDPIAASFYDRRSIYSTYVYQMLFHND